MREGQEILKVKFPLKVIKYLLDYIKYRRDLKNFLPEMINIAVIYCLVDYQKKDFIECIENPKFSEEFPVYTLRNKKVYIIESSDTKIIKKHEKLIILFPSPKLLLIWIQLKGLGFFKGSKILLHKTFQYKLNYKKFLKYEALKILNTYKALDIYSTISCYRDQREEFFYPRSSRNYTTHIIHYSQNSIPKSFRDENLEVYESKVVSKSSPGDTHWVWTEQYAQFLKKINSKIDFKAVGSITFKMGENKNYKKINNRILIFDVAVLSANKQEDFYNLTLANDFINDIIYVRNKNSLLSKFDICLKPKRPLSSDVHNIDYLKTINNIQCESNVEILDWDMNPYQAISDCSLIISIPFTSIAQIGLEVNTPTIFYYPYLRELNNFIYDPQIPVIYGRDNLKNFMIKKLIN